MILVHAQLIVVSASGPPFEISAMLVDSLDPAWHVWFWCGVGLRLGGGGWAAGPPHDVRRSDSNRGPTKSVENLK